MYANIRSIRKALIRTKNRYSQANCAAMFLVFVAISFMLNLTGCATNGKKNLVTPLNIEVSEQLNPDIDNASRPINIKVLFLKNGKKFSKGRFSDLFHKPEDYFSEDLTHVEALQLLPGKNIRLRKATPNDTQFIAVVAAFRSMTDLDWKAISPVPKRCWGCPAFMSRNPLTIGLSGTKVSINTGEKPQ